MVLQEMSAPERGMKDFRHEKCDTKLTLIVLVQLKTGISIAFVQLTKISKELKTGTSSKYMVNTHL